MSVPGDSAQSSLILVQPAVRLARAEPSLDCLSPIEKAETFLSMVNAPYVQWQTLISSAWRRSEHINTLELRAVVLALRRMLSSPAAINSRLMLLCDSAVA